MNTGDVDLWMSLWDENGIRLAPDVPAAHGKAQILPGIQKAFGAFNLKVDIKSEEIVVLGDYAFSSGTRRLLEDLPRLLQLQLAAEVRWGRGILEARAHGVAGVPTSMLPHCC